MRTLTSMTTATALHEEVASFRLLLAAEVRAELARRQITGRQLARLVGESPAWAARRLAGGTAIDADDVQRIASAINVPISQLLIEAARRTDEANAELVTGVDTRQYSAVTGELADVIPLVSGSSGSYADVPAGYGSSGPSFGYGDGSTLPDSAEAVNNANAA